MLYTPIDPLPKYSSLCNTSKSACRCIGHWGSLMAVMGCSSCVFSPLNTSSGSALRNCSWCGRKDAPCDEQVTVRAVRCTTMHTTPHTPPRPRKTPCRKRRCDRCGALCDKRHEAIQTVHWHHQEAVGPCIGGCGGFAYKNHVHPMCTNTCKCSTPS